MEITTEDLDCLRFGGFAHLQQQLGAQMQMHFHAPGPIADIGQPFVGTAPAILNTEVGGNHRRAGMRHDGFETFP